MQATVNNNFIIEIQNKCYVINITKIIYVSNVYENSNKIYFQINYNDNTQQEIYYWKDPKNSNEIINKVTEFLTDVKKSITQRVKSLSSSKNIFNL